MHIKKGDMVVVIAGKDKGKKGKVLRALPEENRVVVENVNIVTKHQKPNMRMQTGGITKIESPIHVSNVMLWDEKAKAPTRIKIKEENGKRVRVSAKSGNIIPDNYKKGGF